MSEHQHHRLQALDGLRALSIALVFFSHAGFGNVVPGGLGVTIFFFISGFIITRLMLSEWDVKGKIGIRQFYGRRLFRLTPALLVFVGVSLTLMSLVGDVWKGTELASVFFYFANYYGIYSSFSGELIKQPLAITWSLAVEEHFYFVFPFLFMLFAGVPRRFLMVLVSGLLLILFWRIYLVYGTGLAQLPHYRIYTATDTRADSILYGVCLSVIMSRNTTLFEHLNGWRAFTAGACIMLLSLAIRNEEFRESLRYSLQGIALFLMFPRLVFSKNHLNSFLQLPFVVYLGRISYSLYLYHWLVIGLVALYLPETHILIRLLVITACSLLLSHLSYRYIEQTFQALGRRLLNLSKA
ncbi:acyltransferase [Undibacterium sp. TS12]|uniref:acyltransferase family protein n=1 Tax=Undibacterium sp. TS12 TaxID=2908202 RepID=UPI001F4C9543|nr:acyltransferase [Undibacterium sp. TS12]MCH8620578.1 acyltransferase [Undibacterium sp. TS12]